MSAKVIDGSSLCFAFVVDSPNAWRPSKEEVASLGHEFVQIQAIVNALCERVVAA